MSKVVLDTNVLVSALIVKVGKPAQILRRIAAFELLTAEEILTELEEVLQRPHITRKYRLSAEDIREYLARLRAVSTLVPLQTSVAVVADPDDNMFVACAIDGGASYIVSGDPHLVDLGAYQGIAILTPAAFLRILEAEA